MVTTVLRQFNGSSLGEADYTRVSVPGAITDVITRQSPDDSRILEGFIKSTTASPNDANLRFTIGGQGFTGQVTSISVTPDNGEPDVCGDPEPSYPPDPTIDPDDFNKTTNINIRNSVGDITGVINVPLMFNVDSLVSFPITVNIGGKDITLDEDGIKDDSIKTPIQKTDEEEVEKPESPVFELKPGASVSSANRDFDETLIWVSLDVDEKPRNAKSQWGEFAPDVFYCGWFAFKVGNRQLIRTPVHWESNMYLAPFGATGFIYTLYKGFSGKANAYVRKTDE